MQSWVLYAIGAAILYAAHQIFTKMAADRISDGLGGFVVEATAAATILIYLAALRISGNWNQSFTGAGATYAALTGFCVGIGTIFFFLLFQKGGPLLSVPMILALGAALMSLAGILFFKEPISWPRLLGVILSIVSLFLVRLPIKAGP